MKQWILLFCSMMMMFSCRKEAVKQWDSVDPNARQHHEDATNIKSESDASIQEINAYIQGINAFGKNESVQVVDICGATVDSSQLNGTIPTLLFQFDGSTVCANPSRIRSGQIRVELIEGTKWTDAGAKLRLTYLQYRVTFTQWADHFLEFNGVKTLTNVNGVDWLLVYLGQQQIVLRERCTSMNVTHENGGIAQWFSARLYSYGYTLSTNQVQATVNGDTLMAGQTVDSWGINRMGQTFVTEMVQPWKSNSGCGWWRPTQGEYQHTTDAYTINARFGTDQNGNPVGSGCANYFKLNWSLTAGGGGEAVLGYW